MRSGARGPSDTTDACGRRRRRPEAVTCIARLTLGWDLDAPGHFQVSRAIRRLPQVPRLSGDSAPRHADTRPGSEVSRERQGPLRGRDRYPSTGILDLCPLLRQEVYGSGHQYILQIISSLRSGCQLQKLCSLFKFKFPWPCSTQAGRRREDDADSSSFRGPPALAHSERMTQMKIYELCLRDVLSKLAMA